MSGATRTCWTMIEAAARGDGEERERFCNRYLPVVETALQSRWRATPRLAEVPDAAQDVFLECLKRGGALDGVDRERSSGFRAYLFAVTRNVARRYETRPRRSRELSLGGETEEPVACADTSLAAAFDRAWAEGIMRETGERLQSWAEGRGHAAKRRVKLLRLRFQDGLTLRAIAEREGLPENRIQKDYTQARQEFGAMLRHVVAWHGGSKEESLDEECRGLLELLS